MRKGPCKKCLPFTSIFARATSTAAKTKLVIAIPFCAPRNSLNKLANYLRNSCSPLLPKSCTALPKAEPSRAVLQEAHAQLPASPSSASLAALRSLPAQQRPLLTHCEQSNNSAIDCCFTTLSLLSTALLSSQRSLIRVLHSRGGHRREAPARCSRLSVCNRAVVAMKYGAPLFLFRASCLHDHSLPNWIGPDEERQRSRGRTTSDSISI